MKRTILSVTLLSLAIFLGACGDLGQDEVMEKIQANTDDVENYHTVWDVAIEMKYPEMNQYENSSVNMDLKVNEPSNEIDGFIEETNGSNVSEREYYMTKDGYYENDNDSGWISDPSVDIDVEDDLTLAYNKITTLVEKIEDELEMETGDDYYTLTFNGASKNVYDAQDEPYSVEVTGFDEDDIIQDLKIEVDKETLHIKHLENAITAENNQNELTMEIEHDFSDINEVDDVKVPDEVKEEAD